MIDQLFEARATLENPAVSLSDAEAIADLFGNVISSTGKPVTKRSALGLSAFWAAVKMISGDTSQLPLAVVDYPDAGAAMPQPVEHYLRRFIRPHAFVTPDTPELTFLQLIRRTMTHALIYENGYIWADFSRGGQLRGLYQLLSDRTAVTTYRGRRYVVTEVSDDDAADGWRLVARPYEEVLHIEGLCIDNLAGIDTVEAARDDIAVGLEAIGFKAKFFANRMTAGGILQAPEGATPDNITKVEKAIEKLQGGDEAFRTLVLRDGFRWHATQVKPGEAQLSDLEETQVREIARRFMMQPARLGVRESISYNSLESEKRDYHGTTLAYWLSSISSQATAKLLTEDEQARGLEVAYNANLRLLWADAQTLAAIASQGTAAGWLEQDEARAWFMLPPKANAEPSEPGENTPPPAGEPNEPPAEPAEPEGDQEPEQNSRPPAAPFRQLLAAELRRAIGRAAVQADRARKRGSLAEYLEQAGESNDAAVAAQGLEPVVRAIEAAGHRLAADVQSLAADAVARAAELVAELSDKPDNDQLLAEADLAALAAIPGDADR